MNPEDKDHKSQICWCVKQKRGIKLEEPNDNLCKAYLQKAKSALNMLDSAIEKEEIDWIATTAYYSRYFAVYALLQKCGIKSEIHDCTLSLMHFLFVEENITNECYYDEILLAKDFRIDTQYYAAGHLNLEKIKNDALATKNFVLEMEKIVEKFAAISLVDQIRNRFNSLVIKKRW